MLLLPLLPNDPTITLDEAAFAYAAVPWLLLLPPPWLLLLLLLPPLAPLGESLREPTITPS